MIINMIFIKKSGSTNHLTPIINVLKIILNITREDHIIEWNIDYLVWKDWSTARPVSLDESAVVCVPHTLHIDMRLGGCTPPILYNECLVFYSCWVMGRLWHHEMRPFHTWALCTLYLHHRYKTISITPDSKPVCSISLITNISACISSLRILVEVAHSLRTLDIHYKSTTLAFNRRQPYEISLSLT